jgi:hypothetical protein
MIINDAMNKKIFKQDIDQEDKEPGFAQLDLTERT